MWTQQRFYGGPVQRVAIGGGGGTVLASKLIHVYIAAPTVATWDVRLPDATTVNAGSTFYIFNDGSSVLNVKSKDDGGLDHELAASRAGIYSLVDGSTINGSWTKRVKTPASADYPRVSVDLFVRGSGSGATNLDRREYTTAAWSEEVSSPVTRANAAGFAIGKRLYFFGDDAAGTDAADVREFSGSAGGSWSTKATLGFQMERGTAAAIDGIGYALGGRSQTNAKKYDASVDTWTAVTALPQERYYARAIAVGEERRIFIAPGEPTPYAAPLMYHPATDTFEKIAVYAAIGYERVGGTCLEGKPYIFGGRGGSTDFKTEVFSYNRAINAWAEEADMGTARADMACSKQEETATLAGGLENSDANVNTVETFSYRTRTFTASTAMLARRSGLQNGGVVGI